MTTTMSVCMIQNGEKKICHEPEGNGENRKQGDLRKCWRTGENYDRESKQDIRRNKCWRNSGRNKLWREIKFRDEGL